MREPLKLSVVIPAHNEEGSIRPTVDALVDTLSLAAIPHEILVVNDHSSDGTAQALDYLAGAYPSVRTIANVGPNGYGHAVRAGLMSFTGDAVCVVMADASDDPRDVVTYYRELEKGYDCVFGSRFIAGGDVQNYPVHKLWINRLANLFIRLLFGFRYNDVTNAFKCYKREVVEALTPILACHFNLTVEMPLKAIVRGFSYSVVPIKWSGREKGISKLRIREMGSRYLFIVLYVFLEKWLSRGDYRPPLRVSRRNGKAGRATPEELGHSRGRPGAWAPLLVFGLIAFVRVVFVTTYPLNDKGGDTENYWTMMVDGTSSLVHAGGYPLIMGAPLRSHVGKALLATHPTRARYLLLAAQHGLDLGALYVVYCVVGPVFGRLAALLSVLFLGLDLQGMGATSAVYPEWLQAGLLVGALGAVNHARRMERFSGKAMCWSVASVLFTACVLVKFNAAVAGIVLCAIVVMDDSSVAWRMRGAAIAGASALVVYVAYVALYHFPSTGTRSLTYDRSWVLVAKLHEVVGNNISPADGVYTKRWLALSSVLPQNFMDVAGLGMFRRIDSVLPETRRKYRAQYEQIMAADGEWLSAFLGEHPLPRNFSLNLSSVPISYFIGLAESDRLGTGMFYEVVSSHPGVFIRRGVRDVLTALYRGPEFHYPLVPTTQNMGSLGIRSAEPGRGEFVVLALPADSWHFPFSYSRPIVWWPGLKMFSFWPDHVLPPPIAAAAGALALGAALLRIKSRRKIDVQSAVPIVLAAILLLVVSSSCAVLVFRWKEARFLLPVTSTLSGVGLGWGLREIWRALYRSVVPP